MVATEAICDFCCSSDLFLFVSKKQCWQQTVVNGCILRRLLLTRPHLVKSIIMVSLFDFWDLKSDLFHWTYEDFDRWWLFEWDHAGSLLLHLWLSVPVEVRLKSREVFCMADGGTPQDGVSGRRSSVRKWLKGVFTFSGFRKAGPSHLTSTPSQVTGISLVRHYSHFINVSLISKLI